MTKVRKAVIPVAGMGTRFLPVTKSVPKEMLPIVDKPTLQYIIEEAVNSGIEEILLITSPYKRNVEDHFDRSYELESRLEKSGKLEQVEMLKGIASLAKIFYIRQGEPMGSGHAIKLAKDFIGNEPFAVMYGDDIIKSDVPALKQLIDIHEATDANVIGVQEVDHQLVNRYGIIEFEDEKTGKIKRIIEKPKIEEAPSNCAGLGRYIVNHEVFDKLEMLGRGAGNEYQFTDAMLALMDDQPFYACKFKGVYFDTGSKIGYQLANLAYALERPDLKDDLIDGIKKLIK